MTDPRRTWVWIAIVLGGSLLAGLCFVPPIAYFAMAEDEDEDADPIATEPIAPPPIAPPIAPPLVNPNVPPPNPPNPNLPAPPIDTTAPRHVVAVVEEGTGTASTLRLGTVCEFDVTRHAR